MDMWEQYLIVKERKLKEIERLQLQQPISIPLEEGRLDEERLSDTQDVIMLDYDDGFDHWKCSQCGKQ